MGLWKNPHRMKKTSLSDTCGQSCLDNAPLCINMYVHKLGTLIYIACLYVNNMLT